LNHRYAPITFTDLSSQVQVSSGCRCKSLQIFQRCRDQILAGLRRTRQVFDSFIELKYSVGPLAELHESRLRHAAFPIRHVKANRED
jgi:hypothetical protein